VTFGNVYCTLMQTKSRYDTPHTADHHLLRSFQVAIKVIRPQNNGVDEKVSYSITILTYVLTGCAITGIAT
jgi:hypothetical protein